MEKIDLSKVEDQFCSKCKKIKLKELKPIMGNMGVFFTSQCNCFPPAGRSHSLTDNELFNKLQTPFWKLMGLKAKPHEVKLDSYLKSKGMTYGDWRRFRDYQEGAKYKSALPKFQQHIDKYGTLGTKKVEYRKESKEN